LVTSDLRGEQGEVGATGATGADGSWETEQNITTDATTSRTLQLTDAGDLLRFTSSSNITVTIPPNSSVAFDIGDHIDLLQTGTGQITVAEGSGVTLRDPGSSTLRTRYSTATLVKIATDEWVLTGDVETPSEIKTHTETFTTTAEFQNQTTVCLLNLPNKKILSVYPDFTTGGSSCNVEIAYNRWGAATGGWNNTNFAGYTIDEYVKNISIIATNDTYPYALIDFERWAGGSTDKSLTLTVKYLD
jgi:hypothetical protein